MASFHIYISCFDTFDDILNQNGSSARRAHTFPMFSHELSDSEYAGDIQYMMLVYLSPKESKRTRY